MGTRFVATREAPVHQNVKDRIVMNSELDTVVLFRKFDDTARVARNEIAEQALAIEEQAGATFEDVAEPVSGQRGRTRCQTTAGWTAGLWWAGLSQALVADVPTCAELVERILAEADAGLARLGTHHQSFPVRP